MNVDLRSDIDVLSICTGGGGLDLGLELAIPSARTVCMVEGEAFAVAHLVSAMEAAIMAPAPVWSDARTFDGRAWRGCVDGLIGGIPCQPHSLAGRKRGSHDERDLWSSARRIIVQSRPWFVLIENVAGMLSPGDDEIAGAERVWRDLQKLGFAVEAGLFTAAEVGAPHERQRIFILGVADSDNARLAIGREQSNGRGIVWHEGAAISAGGGELELSPSDERGEGRAEPVIRSGRDTAASAGEPMGNADSEARAARIGQPIKPERRRRMLGERCDGLFPPGPADLEAWRAAIERTPELEPAVRGLADGLASTRVDWLRLLGNGVVPLQAAYAIRTLATRLSRSGSTSATRLVRMMETAA